MEESEELNTLDLRNMRINTQTFEKFWDRFPDVDDLVFDATVFPDVANQIIWSGYTLHLYFPEGWRRFANQTKMRIFSSLGQWLYPPREIIWIGEFSDDEYYRFRYECMKWDCECEICDDEEFWNTYYI